MDTNIYWTKSGARALVEQHWRDIAGRVELSSAGVDSLQQLVGEVVPPLVDAWLELLPAGERVGELFEAHSEAAQLVRGHRGGRGERAEGLWGHGWQGYFGQHQELLGNMEARQNFLGARLGAGASYTGHGAGQ